MLRKKDCRNYYKELRNSMTQIDVWHKSNEICQYIIKSEMYHQAKCILGYYPLGNEVDCRNILQQALLDGKVVALPRTESDGEMQFYKVSNLSEDVVEGRFHIMEPQFFCTMIEPIKIMIVSFCIAIPLVVMTINAINTEYSNSLTGRVYEILPLSIPSVLIVLIITTAIGSVTTLLPLKELEKKYPKNIEIIDKEE